MRLTAGQRVEVQAPRPEVGTTEAAMPARAAPLAPEVMALAPSSLPPERPPADFAARLAPLASASGPSASASTEAPGDEVERALAEADGARQRGDRAAAVRHFEAAIAATSVADPRRGMAALSLARLLLPSDPGKAASVLRAPFAAVPRALQEDAWARRVEAEGRAGNLVEAARLAAEYEPRFPNGQRSEEVRRWSDR